MWNPTRPGRSSREEFGGTARFSYASRPEPPTNAWTGLPIDFAKLSEAEVSG
jgi:hypothetical protein